MTKLLYTDAELIAEAEQCLPWRDRDDFAHAVGYSNVHHLIKRFRRLGRPDLARLLYRDDGRSRR